MENEIFTCKYFKFGRNTTGQMIFASTAIKKYLNTCKYLLKGTF